jgi:hypothetical protein
LNAWKNPTAISFACAVAFGRKIGERIPLAVVGADTCVTRASWSPAIYGLEYTGPSTLLAYGVRDDSTAPAA